MSESDDKRSLKAGAVAEIPVPELAWRPPRPVQWNPGIALVGCGGITETHLQAYRNMGWRVVALHDPNRAAAEARRDAFYPEAAIEDSLEAVLARDDVEVVDVATHVAVRPPLVRQCLEAGRHVLSQKPFVTDLAVGRELADLADARGVQLAVNQNGRWAPYFSWLRQAVGAGLLGRIRSVDLQVHWDHTWVRGTAFEQMRHLLLYDFAIHWFDIVSAVFAGRKPLSVYARAEPVICQDLMPPMNAQALVDYDGGQASLVFRALTVPGPGESCVVTGDSGTFRGRGPVCGQDDLEFHTAAGRARVTLEGNWFPDGFAGAMGELLCAVEENRPPNNSARANLDSLALCFAAVRSADSGQAVDPATVTSIRMD